MAESFYQLMLLVELWMFAIQLYTTVPFHLVKDSKLKLEVNLVILLIVVVLHIQTDCLSEKCKLFIYKHKSWEVIFRVSSPELSTSSLLFRVIQKS